MKAKSSAHYQREYRRRLREMGLVKKEIWVHPDNAKLLRDIEKTLRSAKADTRHLHSASMSITGDSAMTDIKRWTTNSLHEALAAHDAFQGESATIELIDGAEPALLITMKNFGDLPLFLTVSGEQIIVEAVLWGDKDVTDIAAFNDTVLRTHKYFPLSTISLDTLADGKSYYHMFGALSATSILHNIVFEIETLASNVIQATEAYSNLLNISLEATN